jgi:hypothetical protein
VARAFRNPDARAEHAREMLLRDGDTCRFTHSPVHLVT